MSMEPLTSHSSTSLAFRIRRRRHKSSTASPPNCRLWRMVRRKSTSVPRRAARIRRDSRVAIRRAINTISSEIAARSSAENALKSLRARTSAGLYAGTDRSSSGAPSSPDQSVTLNSERSSPPGPASGPDVSPSSASGIAGASATTGSLQNRANSSSKTERSEVEDAKTVRSASRTSSRSPTFTEVKARRASPISAGPTSNPRPRSRRPKSVTFAARFPGRTRRGCRSGAPPPASAGLGELGSEGSDPLGGPAIAARAYRVDRFQDRAEVLRANAHHVLLVLAEASEGLLDRLSIQVIAVQRHERRAPVERLGDAGDLRQRRSPDELHERADLVREIVVDLRHLRVDDPQLFLERRVVDPEVQATAAQCVAQLARAVAGEHHVRNLSRPNRPDLGDAHLKVREDLEQKRLELLVRAVHLVDQQHGRALGRDRLQQRALQEKRLAEDDVLLLLHRPPVRLLELDAQHLPLVVPLVERGVNVEPLVALQPDQVRVQRARHDLGDLGLPDAGLSFDEQGFVQHDAEVHRRGQVSTRNIPLRLQNIQDLGNAAELYRWTRRRHHPELLFNG